MGMLPNFLVIGARRAGTTWIHRKLSQHPQVFMPMAIKELHFFDRHFNMGLDHYRLFFSDANGEHHAIGEATPAYLHTPDVCARIHVFNAKDQCRISKEIFGQKQVPLLPAGRHPPLRALENGHAN
jgi:hypothetical protein